MTVERILPVRHADDGSVRYPSVYSPSDNSIAVCHMVPDHVIPIIFVPGVMGSNLKNNKSNDPVWLVNNKASMAAWLMRGPAERKQLLDPANTEVFDGGALPKGTTLTDAEKKARGWGTVAKMSYGDWLVWLENALNDCHAGTNYGRKGLRNSLIGQAVAPDLDALTDAEVEQSYQYGLPVHAVGYNWLKSNEESGEHLANGIDRIMALYRRNKKRCDQVIVITHSMGGLVARHCSEVRGYRDRMLGIVSGVQVCVPFAGFGHEGAYKNEPLPGITNWTKNPERQRFTLWAVTKIAYAVRQTSMAYTT